MSAPPFYPHLLSTVFWQDFSPFGDPLGISPVRRVRLYGGWGVRGPAARIGSHCFPV